MSILQRRDFFQRVAGGLCGAALAHLGVCDGFAETPEPDRGTLSPALPVRYDLTAKPPPHFGRARSVIHLFMNGGPSQMDLFDPKEALEKHHGEPHFDKIAGEVEFPLAAGALMRSMFKFAQHGQSGMWVSSAMPHLARQVDEIALLRGMYTTNLTHEPAIFKAHSGQEVTGHPSIGSWVTYGLGTENQNLPAFVSICPTLAHGGITNWGSAFLPAVYQGTPLGNASVPADQARVRYIQNNRLPREVQQRQLEQLARFNREHESQAGPDPSLEARINTFELAFRMQTEMPLVEDLSNETVATQDRKSTRLNSSHT